MRKAVTYFSLSFWFVLISYSQNFPEKGMPYLQYFTPDQYDEKGKIWGITSADNGIVYMVSDKGLLEYDGKTWKGFKGSNGVTRSVLLINDSLIYTGSDLDFGVWKRNKYQTFEYTSLYPFEKDLNESYEEFWAVNLADDNILFISFQNIYVYKNRQLTRIPAPNRFTGSFSINDTLFLSDQNNGLYSFSGLILKHLCSFPEKTDFQIAGIFRNNKGLCIVTRNSGLFSYESGKLTSLKNSLSAKLRTEKVFSFEQIDENHFAYGTVLGGLYIADSNGKIIHYINKQKGLPNNTILSLHYSKDGKLWMGMDYGISSLHLRSNLTYFLDYRGDFGTASAAVLRDDILFLGTNQGLYRSFWKDLNNDSEFNIFTIVPGTEGQVWTLRIIDNTLLIGHDLGLFSLKEMKLQRLSDQPGVWTILPFREYLLTGNYNGISIFEKKENGWTFLRRMEHILGSCNQLLGEGENVLWVNIPNFGIIRASLDNNLYPVERLIFPENDFSGSYPYLLQDTAGIRVLTDMYEYHYDPVRKQFINEQERINQPRVEGLLSGIYKPSPLNSDYDFYPVYNGFALNYRKAVVENIRAKYNLILRQFEAFNNQEKVAFYPAAVIPYRLNNIRIECLVPNRDNVVYQYSLDGSDSYSKWDSENTFTFLGLKEGVHTLSVSAQVDDVITEAIEISFRITPPWYRSWYSYTLYLLLALFIVYMIYLWRNSALKRLKAESLIQEEASLRRQSEQYEKEIMRLEQERLQSEYDQLRQELRRKTIDLANKAKENEDKNRLLLTLKDKCDMAHKDQPGSARLFREMQKLLDSYINVQDKTFEIQMDELHQDFFRKLKEKFPGLSNNDLRLCAYLKIGLNSKEIADLLNIQPSSAYINRSRLRKKLNLEEDEDLHDFLINI